jgi:hypothetical protein
VRKAEVTVGKVYIAKISNKLSRVRLDSKSVYRNGWEGTNLDTGRKVHIRSAAKLREEVK